MRQADSSGDQNEAMSPPRATTLLLVLAIGCAGQSAGDVNEAGGSPQDSLLAGVPFIARGHEPGWILRISGDSIHLVANYGEDTVDAVTSARTSQGGATTLETPRSVNLTVTVVDEACEDGATGMPHPRLVLINWATTSLRGCGGQPQGLLTGNPWTVMDLEGEPVSEPVPTLQFTDSGRVQGTTSCNQYSGPYTLTGEGLRVGAIIATKRACLPPTMEQEQRFLLALERVDRFAIPEPGRLQLIVADSAVLLARRGR
jgi:heat shock protein HslJ